MISIGFAPLAKLKKSELLLLPLPAGSLARPLAEFDHRHLGGVIAKSFARGDFTGKSEEPPTLLHLHDNPVARVLLLPLGDAKKTGLETCREAIAQAASYLRRYRLAQVALALTPVGRLKPEDLAQAFVEGLALSAYAFNEYKKPSKQDQPAVRLEKIELLLGPGISAAARSGAERGRIIAEATKYARDLANHPGNRMTPETLAEEAVKLAKTTKLAIQVFDKKAIEKIGMHALLAVNSGSDLPPKFIVLEYKGRGAQAPVVLVGKGITFDSGGISIKPSKSMEEMKFDMAGAATVLGIMRAAAELNLKQRLIGLIPATENMPSGSAMRPGDIIDSLSGKTIEVFNTDAEGRLILADALAYAARYQPRLVIDYATLTGSVVAALGDAYTGAFTDDKDLLARLARAGEKTGELVWPLPMPETYAKSLKSDIADINNIGTMRYAGASTAALFLKEFISYPWIHLDIAGTAWATEPKPYRPRGATGIGVRLTLEFLR